MSWLARSLANSLGVDDGESDDDNHNNNNNNDRNRESPKDKEDETKKNQIDSSSDDPSRGVKEDLSELTKTLTRQLWGVASFLAPPPTESSSASPSSLSPPPPPPPPPAKTTTTISSSDRSVSDWNQWESFDQSVSGEVSEPDEPDSATIAGIRNDFAEIGGRFRTGISKLSNHKAVSEISKIASTFLPFGSEEDPKDLIGGAVGVTNEVLTFARNISMHPETWLDFPLADEEDSEDFDMSDAQQEHALAVERLAPRLAALRIELCPGYMSEGCFWKIYFVLLHPRLSKHDAELLSTPQIVEARAMLMHDIHGKTKSEPEWSGSPYSREPSKSQQEHHFSSSNFPTDSIPPRTFASEHSRSMSASDSMPLRTFASEHSRSMSASDFETEKHPVVSTEMQVVDKSVVEEEPVVQNKSKDLPATASFKALDHNYEEEEDGDDWLKDESSEMGGFTGTTIPIGSEEDVSFSDLEEDDDGSKPTNSRTVANSSNNPPTKDSRDWIQLSTTPGKDDRSSRPEQVVSQQSHADNLENKDSNDWLDINEIDVA